MQRIKRTNPEMWDVEMRAQWAEVDRQFLPAVHVNPMFEPWNGHVLEIQDRGSQRHQYVFHLDLSLNRDNPALVIAHAETFDDPGRPDIIIDLIRVWRPEDFPEHYVDFRTVEAEVKTYMDRFGFVRGGVDQWNAASIIQNLRDHARTRRMRVAIEPVSTSQTRNREFAQTFKTFLYERRIHAPFHELARDELLYLRDDGQRIDHPSTGPCTTNDIATCLFEVVMMLTDLAYDPGRQLSALGLRGRQFPQLGSDDDVF